MSQLAVVSATVMCSFGTAPAPLKVTSQTKVLADGKPSATIQDCQAGANIGPFGMCTTVTNPAVASATTAALGVLTPQPCMPVAAGTWIPTAPKIIVDGKPVLTSDCKMLCAYGGNISMTMPGQVKVTAG